MVPEVRRVRDVTVAETVPHRQQMACLIPAVKVDIRALGTVPYFTFKDRLSLRLPAEVAEATFV